MSLGIGLESRQPSDVTRFGFCRRLIPEAPTAGLEFLNPL